MSGPVTTAVIAENSFSKALVNLLDNAADASPEAVHVAAQWDRQTLQLTIIDQGGQLSDEAMSKIGTKPFSNKPDGIGIGAFLAHEIVRRLGGQSGNHRAPIRGLTESLRFRGRPSCLRK